MSAIDGYVGFTTDIHGAVRYAAPELYVNLSEETRYPIRISTHSDIYSFGSIMLHVGVVAL